MQMIDRLREKLAEYIREQDAIAKQINPLISRHDALDVIVKELELIISHCEGRPDKIETALPALRRMEERYPEPEEEEPGKVSGAARVHFAKLGEDVIGHTTITSRIIAGVISTVADAFTIRDIQEMIPPPAFSEATIRSVVQRLVEKGQIALIPNTGLGRSNPAKYRFLQKQVA